MRGLTTPALVDESGPARSAVLTVRTVNTEEELGLATLELGLATLELERATPKLELATLELELAT